MKLLFDRVYVINLQRRPDKLARVMDELAKHDILGVVPVEIIPAVDGNALVDEDFLAANNFDIYQDWVDPWWGRGSLKGEIGCNISHYKIWERVAESEEKVLILEDDVTFDNDFLNRSIGLVDEVENLGFEFLYLARKAIFPEKDKNISANILIPNYSYWLCSYVLTPDGAKKLIGGNYNKNINVPADEYVPYKLGAGNDKLNEVFDLSEDPQDLKGYGLIANLAAPNENAFEDSETEKSEPFHAKPKEEVKVFAFATEKNDGTKLLYESALKYAVPVEFVGLDRKWSGGDTPRLETFGGGQKINILKQTIKDLPNETLVVFTDGYDVLYNEGLNKLIKNFKTFNTKVLFGAETSCWPDESLKSEYPETVLTMNSPFKFLNSGVIIGYVEELKKITKEDISDTDDDQLYYTKKYLSNQFDIKLDHNCEVIQNTAGSQDFRINKLNSKFENTLFDKTPCIVHGNGDIDEKIRISRISSFMINFKNHYGYSPVNETEVSNENLPNIVYSINLQSSPDETQEALENLLDLDYPPDKINLHINVSKNSELNVRHEVIEAFGKYKSFFYTDNHENTNILRENAFKEFLELDFEYLLTIDSDCRISQPEIIQYLIKNNKNFVSPLLKSRFTKYSNYWCGEERDFNPRARLTNTIMGEQGTDISEYNAIVDRNLRGCFNVLYADKCFLIKKDILSKIQDFYRKNESGLPYNINFCCNMINEGLHMYLDNQHDYGNIV
tara:strand:- start:193 stop:2382 length:2190 start_codon:yes stop_codon:yes gene_type:complete